jgi:outer membrane protein TolC
MRSTPLLASIFLFLLMAGNAALAQEHRDLDFYLNAGLRNSPMLFDSTNRFHANLIDSLKILAGYRPQVTSTGNIMLAPVAGKYGYDSAITNGANYTGVVTAEQQLFTRRPRNVQFRNITLLNQALRLNVQLSEMDLRKSITAQYITAYSDLSQVAFNENLLKILEEAQEALKRLVKNGIYLQTDYLNLNLSILSQKIAIKRARIQYRTDVYALNLLCGITDRSEVILVKPGLPERKDFFIYNSPQMLRYRIDSLKIRNARDLIDLNYRPKLSAFANGGINAINPANIPHNLGTSFGLNFSTVIYDGHLRRMEYNRLALQESSRRKYREFYTSQYQIQLNQLQEKLSGTEELIAEVKEKVIAQKHLLDIYKLEIFKGLSDLVRFTDFILNVTNYTATQNELIQAENDRLQILNDLNYLK